MQNVLSQAFVTVVCLTVLSFVYQFMTGAPKWDVAAERSFFQFVGISAFVIMLSSKRPVRRPSEE